MSGLATNTVAAARPSLTRVPLPASRVTGVPPAGTTLGDGGGAAADAGGGDALSGVVTSAAWLDVTTTNPSAAIANTAQRDIRNPQPSVALSTPRSSSDRRE